MPKHKNIKNSLYQTGVLPNGLTLAIRPMEHAQSVSIGVWVKTGGRYEKSKESGISHFIEHMLFKGTKTLGCEALKRSIEGVGGSLNGFTSEEFTCYLAKVPAAYWARAAGILSDMVLVPRMKPADIEKEREVIIEEIRMYEDLPSQYVHDIFNQLLWPNHPLGNLLSGTQESVKSIHRPDLLTYMKRFYHPKNILVSCAGAIEPKSLESRLKVLFSKAPKQDRPNNFLTASENQNSDRIKILNKKTEQTHLCFGTHSIARNHPNRFAQEMLHVLLGGNMSSRLFHQVREKRALVYEIGTHIKRYADTGAFVIYAGCDPGKLYKTLETIGQELKLIKKEPVGKTELRRAKEFYAGQLLMGLEDTMEHMLWMGEQMITAGKLSKIDDILKRINSVQPSQIRSVANGLFKTNRMALAVIGPVAQNEEKNLRKLCQA